MSWPQWAQTAVPPVPQPPPAPSSSVPVPIAAAPAAIPPAPTAASYSTGMTPPASYTPAQFAALPTDQQFAIQQNWQQWQTYHQQYAQWHAQYGEQYQREMQAKLGVVAPSLPFVPPVPPYNATAAPPAPTTYSVPPPPPIEQTNVLNTPNISAAASQPPPPPPPVEESVEKKVQSFEHPTPPVNPIGPVAYPNAPPPPPDDPMPPQQFKEQIAPNQMQLQQQQQSFQQFQQQQQQNQYYQRPLQQQDSQQQNRYQQHPEPHLQNRYQSLEPQQQNRFQQQDSPHQNRFQQQESQQNRFQQQEPQQQNRFQQQEPQKQNRFQQQESPQQNRYQQQEPQQQNRYQQQEPLQQNRYQQQEPQQQNRFQQQQPPPPQWKPNNDSRNFNDRRGGFDGNDRNRNNFEDNFNNRGGRDWGRADNDNNIGRNPWQSNQQPFQGPVQIQSQNDQSTLNQQPPGQLSQSLIQTPEKQKPDESTGDVDGEKTPEEKAFDEQFQKWEEQFENWKKENANHPDRKAYREYEMKFEDCRRKLLERREVMKKRKIEKKLKEEQEIKMREEYQRSLMPKVEEQEKMREEHQRSLMPKVEDNVKEHQSNLPAKIGDNDIELQQSPAPKKEEDKVVLNLSDTSKEVDVKTDAVPEQKEVIEELKQESPSKSSKEVSSDKAEQGEVVEFLKTTKSEGGIPGLDLVAEEKPVDKGIDEDITEVIDLEADTKPERCEEKPTSSVRFPDHRPEMNQMNMSMMGSPHMIPDRQPIFSSINRIDPPPGKREIPSLLSQKFEMPVMSPPGDNRRSFDNFDSRKNVEGMNQQSPFNKLINNDNRGGFDNFDKDVKNVEVLSQQNAFHQQSLGDDRGNSDNFENNRKNVPGINQPNPFNEQSPKDGGREDFDNFDNNRNNAQAINQQPSNESFGKFLENTASNKVGNDANSNLVVDDKGNVPTGIAELANVLADPNVLALLSAAIGNNGGGSGDVGGAGNIMHGLTELENQAGGPKMSPWAMGQAPFQAQNQMFPNQFRGGPQQGGNFRDFGGGGGGNHNNSGNMWQDQNQSNSNSPWSNRNLGDNRGNMQPWQNRSNRQDDFRRGGNWSNRDRDMGDRKNTSWQDDVDMRSNMFDRNIFGSGGGGDERSRSSERMADRERVNPFKDHDDRGGRANTFGNNDRERGRQRENRGDRSRSGGSRNNNNNNNNRDRSRSSGNSGGRQDENSNSGSHRNPFKNEQNIFDKSPAPSIPSLGGLQHGGGGNNDEFFRPAHVIDYQNKSLGGGGGDGCGDVGGSDANENDNIVLPTKVVDYGHGGNNSEQGGNKDFFPMKTIDYGHSSANNPNFESNLEGRRNDFNAGRNRNRNRNRNNNNKKKSGLPQESNSTYPGRWFLFNVTSQQRPGLPTKRGKRRKTIRNLYENEFLITPDCRTDSFFFEQADKLYETLENVDDISEDDNDFDAFESNNPSEIEELDDAVVVGTPSPVSEDVELVPVFPIKEITPPESIKKPQLIVPTTENNNTITIDEILLKPGRESRPKKIVIILRGPPGSGKSYVAKLIKDKEVELGGSTPRLLSIDDYFMTEIDKEEKCLNTGRKIIKKEMVYEYEKEMEQNYMQYLIKSFKKTVNDRLFNFVIVDCVNYSLRTFTEFYNNAKSANFTPYTIDLLCDLDTCLCRNIHNRSIKDIQHILDNWTPTPDQYIKLDVRSLIQSAAIREYKTEDAPDMGERASDITELSQEPNDYSEEVSNFLKSKWDVDASEDKLARLDGTSKPLQKNTTIEDYLQMDGWQSPPATSKKKRVRWADIEEKRAQDKMRAIGFVVGQTDWSRMMDPTAGSSALTKTKYIAKVKKRK